MMYIPRRLCVTVQHKAQRWSKHLKHTSVLFFTQVRSCPTSLERNSKWGLDQRIGWLYYSSKCSISIEDLSDDDSLKVLNTDNKKRSATFIWTEPVSWRQPNLNKEAMWDITADSPFSRLTIFGFQLEKTDFLDTYLYNGHPLVLLYCRQKDNIYKHTKIY